VAREVDLQRRHRHESVRDRVEVGAGAGVLAGARGADAVGTRHLQQALTLSRELGLGHYEHRAEQLLAAAESTAAADNDAAERLTSELA